MKKISLLLLIVLILIACSRKTVPQEEIILSNSKKATTTKATPDTASVDQALRPGMVLYVNRCGRCHALKPVSKFTKEEWTNILQSMIPKAKLDASEARQLKDYVMAYAKG